MRTSSPSPETLEEKEIPSLKKLDLSKLKTKKKTNSKQKQLKGKFYV